MLGIICYINWHNSTLIWPLGFDKTSLDTKLRDDDFALTWDPALPNCPGVQSTLKQV